MFQVFWSCHMFQVKICLISVFKSIFFPFGPLFYQSPSTPLTIDHNEVGHSIPAHHLTTPPSISFVINQEAPFNKVEVMTFKIQHVYSQSQVFKGRIYLPFFSNLTVYSLVQIRDVYKLSHGIKIKQVLPYTCFFFLFALEKSLGIIANTI